MEPAVIPGDVLYVAPASAYRRGDIVTFHPPTAFGSSEDPPFIKRIVGLPGESISIRDDRVFVNARPLDEPYIYRGHEPHEATNALDGTHDWVVPAGQLFVLGDHRTQSADSRVFGPIPLTSVIGRVTWRCAPSLGPIG